MTQAGTSLTDDPAMISRMPGWITLRGAQTPEDVAFLSGAALSSLHLVLARADLPQALLRERLALRAAEACVGLSGRSERAGALRDEVHLLRPADQPGPAGAVCLQWRRAVDRPVAVKALHRALPGQPPERIAAWLEAGQGAPVARAAAVIGAVLADAPRAATEALILGDGALAQALGWDHLVPLLATGLKPRDLRNTGDELRLACHRAVVASVLEASRLAADLTRRAGRLRGVAPRLRARGAGQAVELFLTRDALAPAALAGLMSDRAARRLCDRLVELGAVRELTGRDTFRLYGV